MSVRSKTTMTAAIAAMALLALTACAPATSDAKPAETQAPSASAEPVETTEGDEPDVAQPATGSQIFVTDVEVVTGDTFRATVATPGNDIDGEPITIHSEGVTAPTEGDCGYSEAIEYAESFIARQTAKNLTLIYVDTSLEDDFGVDWIDANGEHTGSLMGYSSSAVNEGFATVSEGAFDNGYQAYQTIAQNNGKGLWALCPGFGE